MFKSNNIALRHNYALIQTAQLSIISKNDTKSTVGTVTIYCEPINYELLVSQTQKQVARSIKSSSHLLEATEDLTEFIDNQSDMYQALLTLCNKLDTFVKLMDKISEVKSISIF